MTSQTVLATYHQRYDNDRYGQLAERLTHILDCPRDDEHLVFLLNSITDAAIDICDTIAHPDVWNRLQQCITLMDAPHELAIAIYRYLGHFQHGDNKRLLLSDFYCTLTAIHYLHASRKLHQRGILHAADIHHWRGRMAHALLNVIHDLALAAETLLINGSLDYAGEKCRHAIRHLVSALTEGVNADESGAFDFSATRLPTRKDRRK